MKDAEIYAKLDSGAKQVLSKFVKANYECYLVGGSLRDLLLHKKVHDYDFTTNARPEQVEELFHTQRVIETGIKHGTVTVLLANSSYEITTFRKDTTYSDHRHPDGIVFADSLDEDLARRDFTINALAWSPERGLVDLYAGLSDLSNGLIRAVNEPNERLKEDALRILRALRFASTLGFEIESKTKQAVWNLFDTLSYVARERILEEIDKLFLGQFAAPVLREFLDLFAFSYPELFQTNLLKEANCVELVEALTEHKSFIQSSLLELIKLKSQSNLPFVKSYFVSKENGADMINFGAMQRELSLVFYWSVYVHSQLDNLRKKFNLPNSKQLAKKLANSMCWSNVRRDLVSLCSDVLAPDFWHKYQTVEAVNWSDLLCIYGAEQLAYSLIYAVASAKLSLDYWQAFLQFVQANSCWTLRDLNLRGDELLKLCPDLQGALINQTLKNLWLAVLKGEVVNEKSALEAYVKLSLEKTEK